MPAQICTKCPDPAKLKHLIDSSLPDDEQSEVVAHLDACESCQKAIEYIASGTSGLLDCACSPEKVRPEKSSAYWPALRQMEREVSKVAQASLASTRAEWATTDVSLDFLDPPEQPDSLGKLGRFHVIELIGRGGMGMVLRALDVCLQRQVALKVLDPQYTKNEMARNRFIREARAAASITHENVVAVHHVEKHREEIPFLVMRLVNGESLQDRLDAHGGPLALREIVRIGQQTAAGLAAAHEQTLIHRDIKPANILLEAGTNKVLLTDFGLARAAEDVKLTQTGFVTGTPLYMSPEQARGETIDNRSDLFSVGSVLYAMSTGNPPFHGSSTFAVLREVIEVPHKPVQQINPGIPDELAVIIDHLLAKDADERIQTAAEVAERLEQLLAKLPPDLQQATSVRRSSRITPRGVRRGWRRYEALLAIALFALNALLLLSELLHWTAWTVIGQRGAVKQSISAPGVVDDGNGPKPLLMLDAREGPLWSIAYFPDGNTVAMGLDDGSVKLWDSRTGNLKSRIAAHKRPVWSVACNFDGSMLATASDDGNVRLWDARTNKELDTIPHTSAVRSVAFSPDGTRVASGTRNGAVRVYDVKTGKNLITTAGHSEGMVMAVAFSSNGKLLASGSSDRTIKIWDVSDDEGKEVAVSNKHEGAIYALAFHPTRKIVASGGWDRSIHLWDIDQDKEIGRLQGHAEDVWSVAFSLDGSRLISGSEDRTVKIWDVDAMKEVATLKGHIGAVYGVAVAQDGKTFVSGSRDGSGLLWELPK